MEVTAQNAGLDQAQALYREGVALLGVGRLSEARSRLEGALSLLDAASADDTSDVLPDHAQTRARVLVSLAFPVAYLGQLPEGLQVLDEAETVLSRFPAPGISALVACNRGLLLLESGMPIAGLAQLNLAVRLAEHAMADERIKIISNRAEAHHMLGHIAEARRDLTAALELARRAGLADLELRATHNLGFVTYLAGDLPQSLALMPKVADGPTEYHQGVIGADRARVLLAAGLVDEADRVLADASRALAATEYEQLLGEAELTRAEAALVRQDFSHAAELSRSAGVRFRDSGNPRLRTLAELVQLRAEIKLGLDPTARLERATTLAEQLSQHGLPDESRTASLLAAEAALDRGAVPEADLGVRRGEPIGVRLHVRLVRARAAFLRGEPLRGRREVRTGLGELAEYQAKFGSFDLQTASAAHGAELAALAVTEDVAGNRPARVLDWLERLRAVAGHVPEVKPPDDPVLAELLTKLRWVVSQLDDEETDPAELPAGRRRRGHLEQEIRSRTWTQRGYASAAQAPSIAMIRSALGEATALCIFWLRDGLYGIVLTQRTCRLIPLGTISATEKLAKRIHADLDALAYDAVPARLHDAARGSLEHGLSALDKVLLAPLALPEGPIVLLPPGRLAGLPWGVLPNLRGRPLTVAPSAQAWLDSTGRQYSAPGAIVAVAGPGLSRAEEEVASVAKAWRTCKTLIGPEATGAAVLSSINGARLVHFAAHGRHQPESPLFSSIRLFDGPIVGYDWDAVASPPRQVVLSACDLGQATVRPGDEALGLTRALLHSGTSTVISGVAKVSDRAAADLMADYHRRLATGKPPGYALADALAAADEPLPFVCFGSGW